MPGMQEALNKGWFKEKTDHKNKTITRTVIAQSASGFLNSISFTHHINLLRQVLFYTQF